MFDPIQRPSAEYVVNGFRVFIPVPDHPTVTVLPDEDVAAAPAFSCPGAGATAYAELDRTTSNEKTIAGKIALFIDRALQINIVFRFFLELWSESWKQPLLTRIFIRCIQEASEKISPRIYHNGLSCDVVTCVR